MMVAEGNIGEYKKLTQLPAKDYLTKVDRFTSELAHRIAEVEKLKSKNRRGS